LTETAKTAQLKICEKYGASHFDAPDSLKLGISENTRSGIVPINGLRHPPEGDTTGWYIWAGTEFSSDPDFFKPLHVAHLEIWCPNAVRFLGLPPGWRFLIAGDYEDVWFDPDLLVLK
jgi:hypothetical protein